MISQWIVLLLCSAINPHIYAFKNCKEDELTTKYSECDINGVTWMYKIPKGDLNCTLNNYSIPKKIYNCGNTCSGGSHLNLTTHECEQCPAGTFSKGDVYELSKWDSIPSELSVDIMNSELSTGDCHMFGWSPMGEYLLGKTGGSCAITLSMQLHNSRQGSITFTYQIAKYGAMGFFTVRNGHCSQVPGSSYPLKFTGTTSYDSVTVQIPKGHNIIQWYLFVENPLLQQLYGFEDPELIIKQVMITGTPPTFTCKPCPPGTYASMPGATQCELCARDTFSIGGQTHCMKCSADYYAGPGSNECVLRQPCTQNDYYSYWTECNELDQTRMMYNWTANKICNDRNGVALPHSSEFKSCLSCPIGTYSLNATHCDLCSAIANKSQNANSNQCVQCSTEEIPVYGLYYTNWSRIPPLLELNCMDYFGNKCDAWDLMQDSLRAGVGLTSDKIVSLKVNINQGFITSSQYSMYSNSFFVRPPIPHTYFNVEFSLECVSVCHLKLKVVSAYGAEYLIKSWSGSQKHTVYSYRITDSTPCTFYLMFEKWNNSNANILSDHLSLHQIKVTNVVNSTVIGCGYCAQGMENGMCKTCPDGLYYETHFDELNQTHVTNCTVCPNNTINIADGTGLVSIDDACYPCGPGTVAVNNTVCVTDKRPMFPSGHQYDLSNIVDKDYTVTSSKMFTPSGTPYAHEFRISLSQHQRARCFDNSSGTENSVVYALVCRHTSIGLAAYSGQKAFNKPMRLADTLIKVVQSQQEPAFWKEINHNLTRAGWDSDNLGTDIHYVYASNEPTTNCPTGRTTVITFRCILTQNTFLKLLSSVELSDLLRGKFALPPKCPDGTCDGCTYNFLWVSFDACRLCEKNDMKPIYGECNKGKREIHYTTGHECRVSSELKLKDVETCPLVTKAQITAICLVLLIVAILMVTIIICYRRNKKLEYKYMKLVQSTSTKQATSCALDENEGDGANEFGRRLSPPPTYTHTFNTKNNNNNNSDTINEVVLQPKHFLSATSNLFNLNKGIPKLNLPPIVFKRNKDGDRDILTEDVEFS